MCAHITFLTLPATGHVNPTLPLVEELTRRGHRVSYSAGPEHADAISAAGATPLVRDRKPLPVKAPRHDPSIDEFAAVLIGGLELTRMALPRMERVLTEDRPDLLCYDVLTTYGPMLAHKLGLTAAVTVPTFASNDRFDLTPLLFPPDFNPSHPRVAEYLAARTKLAEDFGVPSEIMTDGAGQARLKLVFIPREFQIEGESFGVDYRFIGPSFGSRAALQDWQPPAGAGRVLFVSLGTVMNDRPDFFSVCTKAFAGTDWHVVMAVGDQADPALLSEVPSNFEVRPYFPQPAVLRHATAFLSHTGMNSTMEALLSQVPLVAYPQTPEQAANGRRAEELGLGRVLDTTAEPDPEVLRRTVDEVASDAAIHANLATMAGHLRAAGGPAAGADALEALLVS